jgi:hypothetical protein
VVNPGTGAVACDAPAAVESWLAQVEPERALPAGAVFQKRGDDLDPQLAWTGVGETGIGALRSHHGDPHLTSLNTVHLCTRTGARRAPSD